jgi:hypothetical protein
MELTAFIQIAIMLVLFIPMVLLIAWMFQGLTEGEPPGMRKPSRVHRKRMVHRSGRYRTRVR